MTDLNDSRTRALAAAAAVVVEADPPIKLHSKGRVLIIGVGAAATDAACQLSASLSCLLLTNGSTRVPVGIEAYLQRVGNLFIDGHLGNFTVTLEGRWRRIDLGKFVDPERPVFDLVLDLGAEPTMAREWGPPGLYRPRNQAELETALAELPTMIGELEKPRFFDLNASICAHGLPGTEGCRRCIDVCPAEAIGSVDTKIQVDANLCQGGGACATTCPTGALTYRYPRRSDTLERLRSMLTTFRASGGGDRPVVVFLEKSADIDPLAAWPERALSFEVLEVGSVGMETWLSTLALGAVAVRILRGPSLAPRIGRALDEQLGFAHAVLGGMGYPAGALSWMSLAEDPLAGEELSPMLPAPTILAKSKRGVLFAALDHLRAHAPDEMDILPVPEGAPFGALHVKAEACTTCFACAFTCPTRALSARDGAIPQLLFVEAACVQCGLCVVTCPEKAITRETRLLLPEAERTRSRVLHEDEPFACLSCGKHFASAGTVRAVSEMLADHPMFDELGIDVLKTCDECRMRPRA